MGFLKSLDFTRGNTRSFSIFTCSPYLLTRFSPSCLSSITFPQSCFTPCRQVNWQLPSRFLFTSTDWTFFAVAIHVSNRFPVSKSLKLQTTLLHASPVDNSIIKIHADTEIPKTLFPSKRSTSTLRCATSFRAISIKIFRATVVLQSIQITLFVFLYSPSNFKIIYSQISKLEVPVIASIPRSPLKFCFVGKLLVWLELLTHGGFPITRTFLEAQSSFVLTSNIFP